MERTFGARPSTLPLAELQARVRRFKAMVASAQKLCHETELWDERLETVRRIMRSAERPDT